MARHLSPGHVGAVHTLVAIVGSPGIEGNISLHLVADRLFVVFLLLSYLFKSENSLFDWDFYFQK